MNIETNNIANYSTQNLKIYVFFRICVGLILLSFSFLSHNYYLIFPLVNDLYFHTSCWGYFIITIISLAMVDKPNYRLQIFLICMLDIGMLGIIFYLSGGVSSGIGNIIVLSVTISNLLLRGQFGLFVAACAAITIVYETFYIDGILHINNTRVYIQAGVQAFLCLLLAIAVQILNGYLDNANNINNRQAIEIHNLENLNEEVIFKLHAGLLVVDKNYKVLFSNKIINDIFRANLKDFNLQQASLQLFQELLDWQNSNLPIMKQIMLPDSSYYQVQFSYLNNSLIMVFIQSMADINKKVQEHKLASLGRLSTNIAHEIRNPLSAIVHASQLLQEENITEEAGSLLQIIVNQSNRINSIVESILSLSKREQTYVQSIDIRNWLQEFVSYYRIYMKAEHKIEALIENTNKMIHIDQIQMEQVLTNIINNSLKYSQVDTVYINMYIEQTNNNAIIDIIDFGVGVDNRQIQYLFEPFYTTSRSGTGLGLYLAKDLSETNMVYLNYIKANFSGSCFRLVFTK